MSKTFKLSDGTEMPMLGMGTWHHGPKNEIQDAIRFAIRNGYRHIDGAHIYLNEEEVGEVYKQMIDDKEIKREELYLASKLWSTHHEPEHVEEAVRNSLRKLNLDYLDLYYIHWPAAFKYGDVNLPEDDDGRIIQLDVDFVDTWKALEECVDKGLIKTLGLCNFNIKQMNRIFAVAKHKPAVLQIESNPRIHNDILRRYCEKKGMLMLAYSPFGSPDLPWGEKLPHILADESLKKVADKHERSVAQVVLRWQLQRGVGIIPKSVFENELLDNLKAFEFELDADDMSKFDALNRNLRKIVPVKKLKNGEIELRDKFSKYFPFHEEETEETLNAE